MLLRAPHQNCIHWEGEAQILLPSAFVPEVALDSLTPLGAVVGEEFNPLRPILISPQPTTFSFFQGQFQTYFG